MAGKRPSWLRTPLAVAKRYGEDEAGYLAAAVSFYGFLSVFPLILLGLAAIGFVLANDPAGQAEWADRLAGTVPGLGPLLGRNLHTIIEAREGATIVGLAALLWSGTRVTEASAFALGRVFRIRTYTSFVKRKLWSLTTTTGLGLLALAGVAVVGFAGGAELEGAAGVALTAGAAVLGFGIDFLLFMVGYRLLIQRPGPPFPRLWPGALLAAAAWTGLKLGGAWLAARQVDSASAVYGTFAVTVGMLVLLNLAAQVFVYGAELNAVLWGGGDMAKTNGDGDGRNVDLASTGQLVKGIASDTATLVRKEVQLAKQEVTEGITGKAKGIAGLAAGGLLALIALAFLGSAAAHAMDGVMAAWLSRVIVAVGYLAIGGLAFAWGKSAMGKGSITVEETRRTVKEDVEWAKEQLRR